MTDVTTQLAERAGVQPHEILGIVSYDGIGKEGFEGLKVFGPIELVEALQRRFDQPVQHLGETYMFPEISPSFWSGVSGSFNEAHDLGYNRDGFVYVGKDIVKEQQQLGVTYVLTSYKLIKEKYDNYRG